MLSTVLLAQREHLRSGGHHEKSSGNPVERRNYTAIEKILESWKVDPNAAPSP